MSTRGKWSDWKREFVRDEEDREDREDFEGDDSAPGVPWESLIPGGLYRVAGRAMRYSAKNNWFALETHPKPGKLEIEQYPLLPDGRIVNRALETIAILETICEISANVAPPMPMEFYMSVVVTKKRKKRISDEQKVILSALRAFGRLPFKQVALARMVYKTDSPTPGQRAAISRSVRRLAAGGLVSVDEHGEVAAIPAVV